MPSRRGAEHATNIMGALAASSRPLSAYDLLDQLRPTGVAAPLTVYRALDKLIKSGKVHRVESLNAFVACREGEHHHHEHTDAEAFGRTVGFAICDECGSVEEFVDAGLHDRISGGLAARLFAPRVSTIEVRGLCSACVGKGEGIGAARTL